jgi:hypothetical protein
MQEGAEVPRGRGAMTRVRWGIVGMAFLGTTINYVDRANLAVAAPFISDELNLGSWGTLGADGRFVRVASAERVRLRDPGRPRLLVRHPSCHAARGAADPADLRRAYLLSFADTALRRDR